MRRRFTVERIPAPFASLYARATGLVIERYYRGLAQEVTEFLGSGLILDLGTGPGYLPIEIVKRTRSIRVVGIDLSRSLIRKARKSAWEAGVADRLHFEVGNAAKLRFPEHWFDMVISTGMLHMLRDPVGVFVECHRVLKKDGEAWFFDPARVYAHLDKKEWEASLSLFERFMNLFLPLLARLNPPHIYTQAQVSAMIRATLFGRYWIQEEKNEFFIRLKK